MNFRKHFSDRLKTWIAESLDAVAKDLPDALDFNQPRPSTGHHAPDVLKPQAGKVTAKTERQGTPAQEGQKQIAAIPCTVVRLKDTAVQVVVGMKSIRFCYYISEFHLGETNAVAILSFTCFTTVKHYSFTVYFPIPWPDLVPRAVSK